MEGNVLTLEQRLKKYHESHFLTVLQEQDFAKISKQKNKFTDELFPPNETSVFSGKTDYANAKPLPKFIRVSNTLILGSNEKPKTRWFW